MKIMYRWLLVAVLLPVASCLTATPKGEKIVVAYVCSWTNERLPDPHLMTHINYAFGHVKGTFDGVDIQNPPFLRKVMHLKRQNPSLKIMLSIGGWTSGNFSEMAASPPNRRAFAKDCRRIVDEYGLDGIDIDWEYPTSSEAGISSSPDDTDNFTLLMRDLRKALGRKKLLTAATIADGIYVDFPACMRYMDFINIMAYDVANPPRHHTTLFRSPLTGRISVEEAVEAHIRNGVPPEKLTLGMPLYGRGDHSNGILHRYVKTRHTAGMYQEQWDETGKVPYLTDRSGMLVWGFDNPRSLAAKCQYIIDRGLLGGMYWECTEDNAQLDGMKTVFLSLMKHGKATTPQKQVLLLTDHKQDFVDEMGKMTRKIANEQAWEITEMSTEKAKNMRSFDPYHVVIADQTSIQQLDEDARKAFAQYVDEGRGSYISLWQAAQTDTTVTWEWYRLFADSLRIAPPKEGIVEAEGEQHPVLWTQTGKTGRNIHFIFSPRLQLRSGLSYLKTPLAAALRWALFE